MSAPVFMICTVQIQEVWRAGIPFRPASRNHVGMRMCRLQQEAPLPAAFFFILQERASYKIKVLRAGSPVAERKKPIAGGDNFVRKYIIRAGQDEN